MLENVTKLITVVVLAGVLIGLTATALAVPVNPLELSDGNSLVKINFNGSNAGMFNWTIDGVDQFHKNTDVTGKQWFWYRIGDTGPEMPLETLGTPSVSLFSTSGSVTEFDGVRLVYGNTSFSVDVTYLLAGGDPGSYTSDIAETINITNKTGSSLNMHFFQYTDLDLNGTPNDDSATHENANTIRQTDPNVFFNETVVTPAPSHWEIATWASTINKLNDTSTTTALSDSLTSIGPTDVAWAFQWDKVIGSHGSFIISKDKNISIVPTPAAILLGVIGLGVVQRIKRRHS